MNKQDWKFVSNWFDDIQRGTFWQRLKGGEFTKLSQRHYLQFPETINRAIGKKINLPKKLLNKKEKYKVINLNYNKIKNYMIKQSRFVKNV